MSGQNDKQKTKNDAFKGNVHFHMITNKYSRKVVELLDRITIEDGVKPRKKNFRPSSAFDVKQLNSSNIRSLASYVTKYVTKNDVKFKCQAWTCSNRVSELYTDIYTTTEFTDRFKRLNAVIKEFEVKDHREQPFLKIKMIDLIRTTLSLYKRLDDKNQNTLKSLIKKMTLR